MTTATTIPTDIALGVAEINRLAAGLSAGDVTSLTIRYRTETQRIRAIAQERVAAGEKLPFGFHATFACAEHVDFGSGHFDRLRFASFEAYAAERGRYLTESRAMLGIEPGPVAKAVAALGAADNPRLPASEVLATDVPAQLRDAQRHLATLTSILTAQTACARRVLRAVGELLEQGVNSDAEVWRTLNGATRVGHHAPWFRVVSDDWKDDRTMYAASRDGAWWAITLASGIAALDSAGEMVDGPHNADHRALVDAARECQAGRH